jgi:hypothetical protein
MKGSDVMKIQAKVRLSIVCPCCDSEELRADQVPVGSSTVWTCDRCNGEFDLKRLSRDEFIAEPTGRKKTPVTVTLRSLTSPAITVKLNTWKYASSQNESPEEYAAHQASFYNEHTCPKNWLYKVEEIECEGDTDPHGLFQFVSVADGHCKHS